MSRRFSLLFYLKKPKNYEGGLVSIYMRVTIGGERTEFATQREVDPTKWKVSAGRVSGTKEDARALNTFLDTLQAKVYEAQQKLVESDQLVDVNTIREIISGKKPRSKCSLKCLSITTSK